MGFVRSVLEPPPAGALAAYEPCLEDAVAVLTFGVLRADRPSEHLQRLVLVTRAADFEAAAAKALYLGVAGNGPLPAPLLLLRVVLHWWEQRGDAQPWLLPDVAAATLEQAADLEEQLRVSKGTKLNALGTQVLRMLCRALTGASSARVSEGRRRWTTDEEPERLRRQADGGAAAFWDAHIREERRIGCDPPIRASIPSDQLARCLEVHLGGTTHGMFAGVALEALARALRGAVGAGARPDFEARIEQLAARLAALEAQQDAAWQGCEVVAIHASSTGAACICRGVQ